MDPDGSMVGSIVALIALIGVNGFFAASEAAVIGLNDNKIKRMADEGDRRAKKIQKLTNSPAKFLATVQTGSTLSGLLAVALVADRFSQLTLAQVFGAQVPHWLTQPVTLVAVTLLLAYFILVLGNLLPRRLAGYFPEEIAFVIASPLSLFSVLLSPVVWFLSASTNLLLRLFGQNPHREREEVTEEEIRMMVDVGEEKGTIEQSEKDMINNIFEFDDRTVAEIMTHRMELTAVENTATLEEIVALVKETGYSRIPVYEEDLDNIIGILYAKDLLSLLDKEEPFELSRFLREPFYVPESTRCTELFKEFKSKKLHMAVVIDEYGGTYGIVTMEDLLESIVGNIQDEYDQEEEEVEKISDTEYTFDGWTSVEEVEHILDIEIPEDVEYDTIGGVVIDMLGDIPREGEHPSVTIGNVCFTVLEVDDRRISKLKANIVPPVDDEVED